MSEPLLETGRERKRKKKSGRKLKVSTFDIQIKQSGLKISNSKVFSCVHFYSFSMHPGLENRCIIFIAAWISVTHIHVFLYIRIPVSLCLWVFFVFVYPYPPVFLYPYSLKYPFPCLPLSMNP